MSAFIEETDYLLYIKQSRLDQLKEDLGAVLYDAAESTAIAIVKDALYGRYFCLHRNRSPQTSTALVCGQCFILHVPTSTQSSETATSEG